ncbi:MAG: hypothetical protein DWQ10_18190 [Calditrichaeota bacterium]|nr:MAG: hypothetical protein DWQ10_18190 [Calditrichota bacterium]
MLSGEFVKRLRIEFTEMLRIEFIEMLFQTFHISIIRVEPTVTRANGSSAMIESASQTAISSFDEQHFI